MTSLRQTISRLSRLALFGFQGPWGRQMKRLVICQWIAVAVFLFLWIKINGGIHDCSVFVSHNYHNSAGKT